MATTTSPSRATPPTTEPFPPLELGAYSSAPLSKIAVDSTKLLEPRANPPTSNPPTSSALSPSTKFNDPAAGSPATLTGLAAMSEIKRRKQQQEEQEARQTSPNPAVAAMQSLMGAAPAVSRPSDGPAQPDKLSEPMRKAAEKIHIPEITHDQPLQASPTSMTSFNESGNGNSAMTATAGDPPSPGSRYVAEPAEMGTSYSSNGHLAVAPDDGNKAFSYPGPPQPEQNQEGGPSRGMSLPGYGQTSPKSPSSSGKRHKCPYCSTDFTRHHNLKSHLLTHSKEKPYVCQTCQSRFRRLHDLKRHTKLHTGERPHTCDKCGRRFARGDALARHNKGPGGCAGRRSSFGGDDEFGDSMDGIEYGDDDDDGMDPHEHSRKRTHLETPQDTAREVYRQHSSTYPPPPTNRPHASSVSSMGPPQVIHPGSNTTSPRGEVSGRTSPAAGYYNQPGQVFGQQSMIESPKPLSPGQPATDHHRLSVGDASHTSMRNRSPSLTTQFQQQQFGRGSRGRTPPGSQGGFTSGQTVSHAPVLPPLQGNQGQNRPILQPSSMPGPSMMQQQHPHGGQGSNPNSLSSHDRSSGSSIRSMVGPDDIWGYVRNLEQRFGKMQDEYELRISRLTEEVISLKGRISNPTSYSSEMNQQRY